ncbi:MAG: type II secretion system minor pseudopilin GspK [Thiotrichales bacterium]|nr:type II secretion system minor pseudopilin GspK [Thiotrichales bacterium]
MSKATQNDLVEPNWPVCVRSQQGFALITVILIAALVAILSAQLLSKQQAQIERSSYMLHQAQSLSVAWGLESWVKSGLRLDAQNNQIDHLNELWAQPLLPIPFEEGEISGVLLDAQASLNLNNLLVPNDSLQQLWQGVFNRYAQQQSLTLNLADLVRDWIDADSEPQPNGAESSTYQLNQPAYSAANQPMVTAQEVLNLEGLQRLNLAQRQTLLSGLTALPRATAVNVNTAPENVLLSLSDWMNATVVQAWIAQRQIEPASSLQDFHAFLVGATGLTQQEVAQALPQELVGVNSQFFVLQGRVDFGLSQQQIFGLFYRNPQHQVALLQRWLSVAE